jgi:molybdate transport system substrate-binding protein
MIKHITKGIIYIIVDAFVMSCGLGDGQSCSQVGKTEAKQSILVFSGASLTNVISEIADSFEIKHGAEVKFNFASSGTLARQIKQGNLPDIYISASMKWADYIDSLGFLLPEHKLEIATNELVLVAPANSNLTVETINSTLNFPSLLKGERLSIGDPAHVPAGKYAKQALEYYGWYKNVEDRLLPAKDVRSALMVVEMEESPLGIVYRTDAQKSDKVKILGAFQEISHERVVYIAGLCKNNKAAKDFFFWLSTDNAKLIWEKHGFGN